MFNMFFYIIATLFCSLNAVSVDLNNDVLLFTQISAQTQRVCITPLAHQIGGSSVGPIAQWVDAEFYYKNSSVFTKILPGVFIKWQLGMGGAITLADSIDSLHIYPQLSESVREHLCMISNETLFFEVEVNNSGDILNWALDKTVTMVRQLADQIICRKKISFVAILVDSRSKGVFEISEV